MAKIKPEDLTLGARRSTRVPMRFPVRLVKDASGSLEGVEGSTIVLSQYGARLECKQSCVVGEEIVVTNLANKRSAMGKVVWCENKKNENGNFEFGVELKDAEKLWGITFPAPAAAPQRIVATAPIDAIAIEILKQVAPVEIAPSTDEDTMMGLLEGTIALVCRGEGRVTGGMIDVCTTLRVIGRTGAGFDTIDVVAATARKIPVINAPVSGFAVAEGALALLLALVKKIPLCDSVVKTGQWQKRYEFKTGDLADHTLGIVGLGKIGAHLAKLAQPFGMTMFGYDPFVSSDKAGVPWVKMVKLPELLSRSDFVSLHVPLMEQTLGLINRERLAMIKRGAILINTSRGGVIESLDLLADALDEGKLSAAGLDVFPTEPPDSSHRIFKDPRVLCAPHVLGVSELAMDRIYRSMANDMVAVLQERPPQYCVNPEVFS